MSESEPAAGVAAQVNLLLKEALAQARQGRPVVPVDGLLQGLNVAASSDEQQICAWARLWPDSAWATVDPTSGALGVLVPPPHLHDQKAQGAPTEAARTSVMAGQPDQERRRPRKSRRPPVSYPWYFDDWLSSETRLDMTLAERGAYRDLLDFCYRDGSIPSDPAVLAKMLGCSGEKFDEVWLKVRPQFRERGSRLWNQKACIVRKRHLEFLRKMSTAGGKSVDAQRERKQQDRQRTLQRAQQHHFNVPSTTPSPTHCGLGADAPPTPPFPPRGNSAKNAEVGFVLTPPTPTTTDRKATDREIDQWFTSEFWSLYPRRVAKAAAKKATLRLRSAEVRAAALAGLRAQLPRLQQQMAEDPSKVPHAASWLNGCRWQDELEPLAISRPIRSAWAERQAETDRIFRERMERHAPKIQQ